MSMDDQAVCPASELPTLLANCEQRVGYEFQDKGLLQAALTHASGAEHRLASNERLEFLGDAILGAVVCEVLFHQYPQHLEGDLTKIKSVVVSRQTCAKISESLGMQEFLILGKGMTTHPSVPPSLLADVFESLVAAIYLDGGNQAARDFVERYIGPEIELGAGRRDGQQLQVNAPATGRSGSWGRRPPTNCSTRKARTTASASRSPRRSAAAAISRRGGEIRRKPSSGRRETPCTSSAARPSPIPPTD